MTTPQFTSFADANTYLETLLKNDGLNVLVNCGRYEVSLIADSEVELEAAIALCMPSAAKHYPGAKATRRGVVEGAHVASIQYRDKPKGMTSRR